MADTTALKNRIKAAIKANDNQEITGPVLQQALLDMVDELNGATETEADVRQSGDSTLQQNITTEKNRAKEAESTLQQNIATGIQFIDGKIVFKNAADTIIYQIDTNTFLNGIITRIDAGAVYAGYAMPSTIPAALTGQKVFYIATQAGTYTHFHFNGGNVGITLAKDGIYFIESGLDADDWNATIVMQLDDVPIPNSNNPIKSGAVAEELALGAVYDVSAHNSGATFASLQALLSDANLNTYIPIDVRKGGMSIKFVQSSDNKYVQARCMAQSFTTDVTQWQRIATSSDFDNPDAAKRVKIPTVGAVSDVYGLHEECLEWEYVILDATNKIVAGIKYDGSIEWAKGVPTPIKTYISSYVSSFIETNIQPTLQNKVDKVPGKGLSTNDFTNKEKSVVDVITLSESAEFLDVTVDSKGKIVEGIRSNHVKVIYLNLDVIGFVRAHNVETNEINIKGINNEVKFSPEWEEVVIDMKGRIIRGIRFDGTTYAYELKSESIDRLNQSITELLNRFSTIEVPECPSFDIWEPVETTDAYKTPNNRSQVTCSLSYQQLLDTYYNIYLHKDTNEYRVERHELGYDSSGDHMIYEYDFIPHNYNRVVMISAGMNACELSGIFGLAYFIKNVIENHGTTETGADVSGGLKYLYENVRFKIIPIICPGSFDMHILGYLSYNGVNINRNFNYNGSWDNMASQVGQWNYKGVSPESEVETQILKKWMIDNRNISELYVDCHTDVNGTTQKLFYTFYSDSVTQAKIAAEQRKIYNYYLAKGLSPTEPSGGVERDGSSYPKVPYCGNILGMKSIMIEQYEGYTGIGGTGMNCEEVDINNYVLMLRAYILGILKTSAKTFYIGAPNLTLQRVVENITKLFN